MYPNGCNINLRLWIIIMICHDLINALVGLMRILNFIFIGNFGFLSNRRNLNRNFNNFVNEEEGSYINDNSNRRNVHENEINSFFMKFVDFINDGNWIFFVFIFIWGHLLLFMTENNCKQGF